MSLILEALKKSEQQRKLGDAPTLGSPVLAARRRRNWLPALAALVIVALGAGWWFAREPATMADAPAVTATDAGKGSSAGNTATKPARDNAQNAQARADALAARAQQQEHRSAALGDKGMIVKPTTRQTPATPTPAKPKTTTGTAAGAPNAASGKAPATTPRAGANLDRPVTPTPLPTQPAKPPPTAATATPPPAATPAKPALPSMFELPYAQRKDIPPIDLSMHVYSTDPAGRFVVIKGDRHVEGDDLGDGLKLKEIRVDGMVLDFKGTVFVFPRDGGH